MLFPELFVTFDLEYAINCAYATNNVLKISI